MNIGILIFYTISHGRDTLVLKHLFALYIENLLSLACKTVQTQRVVPLRAVP